MGKTCDYLSGGLAFRYGTIAACGVVHHGRGTPILLDFDGGPLPLEELLERRSAIADGTHPSCSGCPNLRDELSARPAYPVTWLGVTHFNYCNVSCTYCWLETAAHSPRNTGRREHPYPILPIVRELIEKRLLSPDAVIDWGGGGEPTLMPDFDESFALLADYGAVQWLHTNAVRMPERARREGMERTRVRVLCSLDSGSAATYSSIKGWDNFARVCDNLARYVANGAYVAVKYIVLEENCGFSEIEACMQAIRSVGAAEFIADINYDEPMPSQSVIRGLAFARLRCEQLRIPFQLGSTGINSAPEYIVDRRVQAEYLNLCFEEIEL